MQKNTRLIYLITTGLLTANMLLSTGMYIFKNDMVREMFESLSYPTHIIYPLAVAKILGLIAIWTNKSKALKEWAYAGFVFDFILAIMAHVAAKDGEYVPAIIALILAILSYTYYKKGLMEKSQGL